MKLDDLVFVSNPDRLSNEVILYIQSLANDIDNTLSDNQIRETISRHDTMVLENEEWVVISKEEANKLVFDVPERRLCQLAINSYLYNKDALKSWQRQIKTAYKVCFSDNSLAEIIRMSSKVYEGTGVPVPKNSQICKDMRFLSLFVDGVFKIGGITPNQSSKEDLEKQRAWLKFAKWLESLELLKQDTVEGIPVWKPTYKFPRTAESFDKLVVECEMIGLEKTNNSYLTSFCKYLVVLPPNAKTLSKRFTDSSDMFKRYSDKKRKKE